MDFISDKHILAGKTWLAKAAIAEASHLKPVKVGVDNNTHQLILVRYAQKKTTTKFNYSKLMRHGPMWTDTISIDAKEVGDITAWEYRENYICLQVVKLLLPEDYKIDRKAHDHHISKIAVGFPRSGREYQLKFNIPAIKYVNIPLSYDETSKQYIQDPFYIPKQVKPAGVFPNFNVEEALLS